MAEFDFSKTNGELESIINDLQSEQLDIDAVIKKYERGISLIDQLEKYLAASENKIKKLTMVSSKSKKRAR